MRIFCKFYEQAFRLPQIGSNQQTGTELNLAVAAFADYVEDQIEKNGRLDILKETFIFPEPDDKEILLRFLRVAKKKEAKDLKIYRRIEEKIDKGNDFKNNWLVPSIIAMVSVFVGWVLGEILQ